jgi:capsular polysaccharide biosynthesis protein
MERTGDVMATWAWGLRRYAAIVVLFVIGIGVLVPLFQARTADVYEAQSQVGPTKRLRLSNFDPLPRFAQSVFDNGAVARAVRDLLGLNPKESVVPQRARLQTAQDNPVMVITGQSSSPGTASAVANKAASTFVAELNRYKGSVGTFAVQSVAEAPAKPDPKILSGRWGPVVGVLAGLVAGLGAVGLIVALRRPVVGASGAEGATGLSVLGRVQLGRKGPSSNAGRAGVGALSRRLLKGEYDVVYVTGSSQRQVDGVANSVCRFLANARSGTGLGQPPVAVGQDRPSLSRLVVPEITAVGPASLETWVEAPGRRSLVLLVVPEGIRSKSLHRMIDAHASGSASALVLVTGPRREWAPRWRTRRADAAAPASGAG